VNSRESKESVNTILHGYRAFVAGDLETVAELLDPDIEWFGVGPEQPPADLDAVQTILTARHADGYRIELERLSGTTPRAQCLNRVDLTSTRPIWYLRARA